MAAWMRRRWPRARARAGARIRRCTNCWCSIRRRIARSRYRITPATRGSRILRFGSCKGAAGGRTIQFNGSRFTGREVDREKRVDVEEECPQEWGHGSLERLLYDADT